MVSPRSNDLEEPPIKDAKQLLTPNQCKRWMDWI